MKNWLNQNKKKIFYRFLISLGFLNLPPSIRDDNENYKKRN